MAEAAGYQFHAAWDILATYLNMCSTSAARHPAFRLPSSIWAGLVVNYRPVTAWDLAAGYSYTPATGANGITDATIYHQINVTELTTCRNGPGSLPSKCISAPIGEALANGKVVGATSRIREQSAASSCNRPARLWIPSISLRYRAGQAIRPATFL